MKPPLALSAVAIAADGSETTWWSGDRFAYNRPQQLSFRTRTGEGFSDAGALLARRIDRDYNDLELYNDIVFVGDDGQIAYEGRIGATPRSTQGGHAIAVQCAGWMAHAKDQKFREVYVERDLSQWGSPSLTRQVAYAGAKLNGPSVVQDATNGAPGMVLEMDAPWPALSGSEALYHANGIELGSLYYEYTWGGSTSDANWELQIRGFTNDALTGGVFGSVANLDSAASGSGTLTLSSGCKYIVPQVGYAIAEPTSNTYRATFRKLAVFGRHGLTKRGTAPEGFYASDVMIDIAQRFAPRLNTAGVQATSLVIPHIAFRDRTTPFDAFLLLNGPHGYELAVWEKKCLTFRPYDLSDYDWQVRMDQPGVDVSLQGDTTEGLANYAVVEFDNVLTGQRDQVSPADDSSLEDTTVDHPANRHGLDVELTVGLTFPTTKEVAIAFGQSYLGEFNRPKNRGQITVQGHILDRAGHWIQPWMVRAGQTISVVDHPNDAARLITETSYDHPSRTVTISTDSGELNMVEAVVDYIKTSLTAANLG